MDHTTTGPDLRAHLIQAGIIRPQKGDLPRIAWARARIGLPLDAEGLFAAWETIALTGLRHDTR